MCLSCLCFFFCLRSATCLFEIAGFATPSTNRTGFADVEKAIANYGQKAKEVSSVLDSTWRRETCPWSFATSVGVRRRTPCQPLHQPTVVSTIASINHCSGGTTLSAIVSHFFVSTSAMAIAHRVMWTFFST